MHDVTHVSPDRKSTKRVDELHVTREDVINQRRGSVQSRKQPEGRAALTRFGGVRREQLEQTLPYNRICCEIVCGPPQ